MMHDLDLPRITRRYYESQARLALKQPANDDDGSFDSCPMPGKARALIAITLGVWAVLGLIGALAFYLTR